jgi:hypothetical protein
MDHCADSSSTRGDLHDVGRHVVVSCLTARRWEGISTCARARADGTRLGRRSVEETHPEKIKAARAMRAKGSGVRKIAAEIGLGVGTVMRLVAAPA